MLMEALINCHLDRSGRLHGEGETGGREAGLGHGGGRATATLARPCATWHLGIHARRMAHDSREKVRPEVERLVWAMEEVELRREQQSSCREISTHGTSVVSGSDKIPPLRSK